MSRDNFNFKFSQCFGDKADIVVTEADIITASEFDHTGNFLATGDKGGRVVLFERSNSKHCEYKFLTEFQSHDAEFDYLKSLEIEEKINQIKWLKPVQKSHFLLSTNDKTIKLWKIYEKNIKLVSENNLSEGYGLKQKNMIIGDDSMKSVLKLSSLKLPVLSQHDKIIAATPKRIYANAHTYHINSISPNSDQETFLSADDLRINLWNYDLPEESFNIVDIKPANMEELTEVITSAEFHPQECNLFMYSSSKGTIKLSDMRLNALCDDKPIIFEEYTNPINHNFFTEITSSISDIKFSPNGRYIASRDYLTVKIWDINMNNKPLKTINIHEQLKERLSDTYENDAIFDKFEVEFSGDSSSVMTGSYNNNFMIYPNVVNTNEDDHSSIVKTFDDNSSGSSSNNRNKNSHNNNNSNNNNNNNNNNNKQHKHKNNSSNNNMFEGNNNSSNGDDSENKLDEIVLQADKTAFRNKQFGSLSQRTTRNKEWGDDIDFKKSILHFSWHPKENSIAIAATNNLFIFSEL
ncbi:similar to Saccharomyces cerevisiae YGL190C CDC55 Non-essential regulatory subunit B of protein phosphatase 2A (PP2A) [Maudiozyma barnettii]|uniref:Protein phosphatase PP2A regulatory subunit B n=1 Tax=Maudiozyma barnettii TaxID=61262 RepID=A0A8H2VBV4_9SACH|nr:protein phosphatase 2A regulatory subunit CDC55 [Kazachstania barnettii]CAB4252420.1 similar to Saccharomyces cerevisiae YGL190C CDC55 Non-essential regulatory subunit B of protein phosphatase 2A (PP2A) [Kazachstania barnettii]CAD1779155.1 similar to Saccharomyces cerevisiae YGL190C CDC55 Non-essential regulatory subunit B of protein phosphatase 2A (PP2A) [Kazachstania barnettii]